MSAMPLYPGAGRIRLRWASLAIRLRMRVMGLWKALIGPTRVYSALSSSDLGMVGKRRPFPGGRRMLFA
jgi:hypothetical protein